jgi:hypothetical protein
MSSTPADVSKHGRFNSYLSQSPLRTQRKARIVLYAGHYGDTLNFRHTIPQDLGNVRYPEEEETELSTLCALERSGQETIGRK